MFKKSVVFFASALAFALAARADVFTRISGDGGSWESADFWTTESARTTPGEIGDDVTIGGRGTVALGSDVTVSALRLASTFGNNDAGLYTITGANHRLTITGADAAHGVLTDSASGTGYQRARISPASMELALGSPLDVSVLGQSWKPAHLVVDAKVTGGTAASPNDISVTTTDDGYLILTNPQNDFVGDLICDSASKGNVYVVAGWGGGTFSDSVLGDPTNVVRLAGKGATLLLNNFDSNGLNRRVVGTGLIRGGQIENQWFIVNDKTLRFGASCVLEPANGDSPFGTLKLRGASVVLDAATTFALSVGESSCDTVAITASNGFTFNGAIRIAEVGEVPEGHQSTLFTVAASAKSVTFSPSSIPEDYTFKCSGDASSGWTIAATKRRTGADVSTYPATLIADTYATVNGVVTQTGSSPFALKVYYGTTDGGEDPSAWESSTVVSSSVSDLGAWSFKVEGLSNETTYYYRYAIESDSSVRLSTDVASFTTRAYLTPDTFTWTFADEAWSAAGAFSIAGPYARLTPGVACDRLVVPSHASHRIVVDADYTVGAIVLANGQNQTVTLTAGEKAHVLTMDNGSSQALLESNSQVYNWYVGANADDPLSLYLASPLKISRTQAYGYDFWLYSKVSGGTSASPTPISLICTSDQYGRLYVHVFNSANDFVGDWQIGNTSKASGRTILYLGSASVPAVDSMLGDAANRIALGSKGTLYYYAASDAAAVCRRDVSGEGTVESSRALELTDACELAPCGISGSGFGTMTVKAAGALADASGTRYLIDIDADDSTTCDTFVFTATAPLTLNGTFVVTPDDESVKIASGTKWTVGTIDSSAGSLGKTRFASEGGFRVYAEGDAENGWTIYAEKKPAGLTLFVR